MPPRISVVIPVSNGEQMIAGCLDAVLKQDLPTGAYEVIVVDNGSTDRTPDVVKRYPVRLITEGVRSSYAARNAGVRAAQGSILAFTDADCRPVPAWLSAALNMFDGGADCLAGCVQPQVVNPKNPWECYDGLFYLNQRLAVARGWAATANLLVRREVFDRVGPFRVVESGGDKEWGLRASAQQVVFRYSAEAMVSHVTRKRFGEIIARLRRIEAGSTCAAWERHQEARTLFSLMKQRCLRLRSVARDVASISGAYLRGRLSLPAASGLLLAWPILEGIRLMTCYREWARLSRAGRTWIVRS